MVALILSRSMTSRSYLDPDETNITNFNFTSVPEKKKIVSFRISDKLVEPLLLNFLRKNYVLAVTERGICRATF